MITLPRFFALAAAALLAVPLHAHDPSESWTEIIVHPDEMELLVTMAQVTALKLIDPAKKIPEFTPENFAQHRPRLLQAGAALFAVTSLKSPLVARKIDVQLTEEGDIAYKIIFARPAPGLLMFEAAFMKKLGEGFGGIIAAADEDGHQLGWDQLSSENTTLVVMLPKPGEKPAKKN
jgi:hypothetical protein